MTTTIVPATRAQGIPLRDREPEQIQETFADFSKEISTQFIRLHAYAREHGLGLSGLAGHTRIPTTILSQAYNRSYPGDYEAIAERIGTFFWRLEQKDKYGGLRQYVATRLAETLSAVFEKTRIIRRIQIIESPEQLGKTRVAKQYTHENNTGRTVYVSLSGGSRSGCGDFIWDLAAALDLPVHIKLREKRIRIKQSLQACDLVIIDEAHLIYSWLDRSIQEFFDYLRTDVFDNGARGVVLIATNCEMTERLRMFKGRTHYNVGQLLGRMRNETLRIDPVEDICLEDVEALVSRYYKPGRAVLNQLHNIAQRPQLGHFGLLEDIMNEAWTRAKARKKDKPDDTIVAATADEILANLKTRKELYAS